MLQYDTNTPVLLILTTYKRNQQSVLNKIIDAMPSRLYISGSDMEVNKITDSVVWDCQLDKLIINESSDSSYRRSVKWFFDNEEEGIVLAHDFIPSDDFFGFCSQLLDKYRDEDRIARINGGSDSHLSKQCETTYKFSSLCDNSAWAGWKKKHSIDEKTQSYIKSGYANNIFKDIPSTEPFAEYLYFKLKKAVSSENQDRLESISYWIDDLLNNRVYITPNIPLSENLTEMGVKRNANYVEPEHITHPESPLICPDYQADIRVQENIYDMAVNESVPGGYSFLKEISGYLSGGEKADSNIPRIIHQIYEDPAGPPEYLLQIAESWKENNPDWEYMFWNKDRIRQFLAEYCPEFIHTYDSFRYDVQRWDTIRYLILYHIGGLYADMDYECLEPIEPLVCGASCCMGMEPTLYTRKYDRDLVVGNALMASSPRHVFMEKIIEDIKNNHDKVWNKSRPHQILESTGPLMTSRVYDMLSEEEKETVTLLPADLVAPLTKSEVQMYLKDQDINRIEGKFEKAFAVHYFLGSWLEQLYKNTNRTRL